MTGLKTTNYPIDELTPNFEVEKQVDEIENFLNLMDELYPPEPEIITWTGCKLSFPLSSVIGC